MGSPQQATSAGEGLERSCEGWIASATPVAGVELFSAWFQEGLLEAEGGQVAATTVDVTAVERAREFLEAERDRTVHSSELESITGLTRYELARQFRQMFGTSPHRYQLLRRVDKARTLMDEGQSLAEVAQEAGFADQAHFTRTFKSAFGMPPGRYRALNIRGAVSR